jgi:hypothetical protein
LVITDWLRRPYRLSIPHTRGLSLPGVSGWLHGYTGCHQLVFWGMQNDVVNNNNE